MDKLIGKPVITNQLVGLSRDQIVPANPADQPSGHHSSATGKKVVRRVKKSAGTSSAIKKDSYF